jgi:hypothetical protein
MTTLTLTVTPAIADEICHALIDAGIRWGELETAARNGENGMAPSACRSIRESAFAIRTMIREQMAEQI